VNAGLACPPAHWLAALRPGGRLIFPWRPSEEVARALLVTRRAEGFAVRSLMGAWFIPCSGALAIAAGELVPTPAEADAIRSLHLRSDRPPDDTAVAVFKDLWFSTAALAE
jgi:protein-L-isoaspartate(D-aspartate) O-methyltransferase